MVFESKPAESPMSVMNEVVRRLNENSRRLKYVEQKVEKIESTTSTLEENVLVQMNDLKINLERIGQKITDLSGRLDAIDSELLKFNKELSKTASKAEVKQLETFIDIINPITSKFVTRDELERIIEENAPKKALRA